jgi:hypothetical protein
MLPHTEKGEAKKKRIKFGDKKILLFLIFSGAEGRITARA